MCLFKNNNNKILKKPHSYEIKCTAGDSGGLKFNVEVCKIDGGEELFQIGARRISGEAWTFKLVIAKLTSELEL
jgi:hypothetical protein